jgi:hypothetical protein
MTTTKLKMNFKWPFKQDKMARQIATHKQVLLEWQVFCVAT